MLPLCIDEAKLFFFHSISGKSKYWFCIDFYKCECVTKMKLELIWILYTIPLEIILIFTRPYSVLDTHLLD